MKQLPIRLGPLALLLTVISICLTVLAILSFTTAEADLRLAEKYAETVSQRYCLETEGQELLARLRDSEPAALGMEQNTDGTWHRELETDGTYLYIAVKQAEDNRWEITDWRIYKDWEEDTDLNIWDGGFRFGE